MRAPACPMRAGTAQPRAAAKILLLDSNVLPAARIWSRRSQTPLTVRIIPLFAGVVYRKPATGRRAAVPAPAAEPAGSGAR